MLLRGFCLLGFALCLSQAFLLTRVPLRSPPGNKVLPDPKLISSSKWRPDAPVPFTAKPSVAAEENGSNTGVVKKRQWRTRIGAAPADFGMKGERMFKAWRDNLGDQWDTFKTEGKNACGILEHMAAFLWPRRNLKAKLVVLLSLIFLFMSKYLSVKVPFILQRAIDRLNQKELSAVLMPTALFVCYGLARAGAVLCQEIKTTIFAYVSQSALRQYALSIFTKLHQLDSSFHQQHPTGLLSVAFVRGIRGFQTVLFQLVFSVAPTFVEVTMVSAVLARRCGMSFLGVTLATFIIYTLFTMYITEWRVKLRRTLVDVDNDRNAYFIDSMMNQEAVKLNSNEQYELERFDDYLIKIQDTALQNTKSIAFLNFGQSLVFSTGLTVMMLLSALKVMRGVMSVGEVVAINGLLLQLSVPFNFIGYTYQELRQAAVDMDFMVGVLKMPLREVLSSPLPVMPQHAPHQHYRHVDKHAVLTSGSEYESGSKTNSAAAAGEKRGRVEFEGVSFRYPNATKPLLRNVTFQVEAGSTVAIVGPSGSGKSTTLKLLTRLFDAEGGKILIDGQDIRSMPVNEVRRLVGVIPQDTILFDETVFYNIKYGNINATTEEVVRAARKARIHDGIMAMSDGYDTRVGERGAKLSGGERQRVSIARAILRDPPVLICDEVTSAVDAFTEKEILDSLREVAEDKTTLVIAHRLASIMDADLIIVMHKGEVVEMGTHSTLVRQPDSVYGRMWAIQTEEGYQSGDDLEDDKVKAWLDSTHCTGGETKPSVKEAVAGQTPPVSIRPDLKAQIPQIR